MCICIYRYVHIHTELTYINYKGFKPINRYITNEQQVTRLILRRTHTDTHTHRNANKETNIQINMYYITGTYIYRQYSRHSTSSAPREARGPCKPRIRDSLLEVLGSGYAVVRV